MNDIEKLEKQLIYERGKKYKGGIYYFTQTELAYNSNRIEGSKLSKEHTASLFETKTIIADGEVIKSDDIVETLNHFRAFDYLLNNVHAPLTEEIIKNFHKILKTGTSDADLDWFNVGEYKKMDNIIGDKYTTPPGKVAEEISLLLQRYNEKQNKVFADIIDFHYKFESIHPFQDGNGRVGRLLMYRECLANNVIPFIIDADHKDFYYRGLREYSKEKGYLRDTCLSAQDKYTAYCKRLVPDFGKDDK